MQNMIALKFSGPQKVIYTVGGQYKIITNSACNWFANQVQKTSAESSEKQK